LKIDWFTLAAQIINFLVLVWLLRRYLYGPIANAIDQREREFADRLRTASECEAKAVAAKQEFEQQQRELSSLKESMLADAANEVELWRQQQLRELRDEVRGIRKTWHGSIAREQQQFLAELRERTARQVYEVTRHVLHELADLDLEERLVRRFTSFLDEAVDDELFASANGRAETQVVVRTAFSLTTDAKQALAQRIPNKPAEAAVTFEVDPELICGIELVVGDHKLQWNVDNYLESLERSITSALAQEENTSTAV